MKTLRDCGIAVFVAALISAALLLTQHSSAQQPGSGQQPPTSIDIVGNGLGHLTVTGGNTPTNPVGCALQPGSNDAFGQFTLTSGSSCTFNYGVAYNQPPICMVSSIGSTGGTTGAIFYSVPTSTQFFANSLGVGLRYVYLCLAIAGG